MNLDAELLGWVHVWSVGRLETATTNRTEGLGSAIKENWRYLSARYQ